MKENSFGPRQWAFVVITGGAACALPFLQTDNAPTSTDNALTQADSALTPIDTPLTSSQQGSSLGSRYDPASPGSVGDIVPPLPSPRLPEWANAARSPFDDLVGVTAAKPETAPPGDPLPMQPLRPWIAGPADAASLVSTTAPSLPTAGANAADGAIARREQSAAEASPWSAEPNVGFTPIQQLASSSIDPPSHDSSPTDDRWPDQAVSAEEIAQVTRSRDRELASAIVAPPPLSAAPPTGLLAAPTLPSSSSPTTTSTLPVAAQRQSGQTYLPPEPANLTTPTNHLNLPPLPEARKSHIIFQPGNWK